MRIIGGKYRGKKLLSPDNGRVRPTSDRAREALFNILRSKLGFDFGSYLLLDVFAGTGAFALEALSQGFASVTLVDVDCGPLQRNVKLFPADVSKINVIRGDALNLPKSVTTYDLLFMDAPYNQGLSVPALKNLAAKNWLKPGALCLVEVERNEPLPLPEGFRLLEERRYGLARVVFAEFIG